MSEGEQFQSSVRKWRVATGVWMALIFVLSSSLLAPKLSFDATLDFLGMLNYAVRKCVHVVEFGILAMLLFRSLYPKPCSFDKARIRAVVLSLAFAASDEFHQYYVPLRSGKASDVLFDAAGILFIAWLIGWARTNGRESLRSLLLGTHPRTAER